MAKSLGRCLRETRDRLHEMRKIVASEGHPEAMTAIDSLLFVAEQETERSLVKVGERRRRGQCARTTVMRTRLCSL